MCIAGLAAWGLLACPAVVSADGEPLLVVVEGAGAVGPTLRAALRAEVGGRILSLVDPGADQVASRLLITVENQRATLLYEARFGPRLVRYLSLSAARPAADQLHEAVAALLLEAKTVRHGPVEVLDPFAPAGVRAVPAVSEVLDPFADLPPAFHAGLSAEVLDPFREPVRRRSARPAIDPWRIAGESADALDAPNPSSARNRL